MIELSDFEPDGHYLPTIKPHSIEKITLHNYYASIFTAGMQRQWPNLVYLGLYSGAGAAVIEDSGRVVMTSALSVLTQHIPFSHYIFVDEDSRCMDALRVRMEKLGLADRAKLIRENVNHSVDAILTALPDWRQAGGVLTFCFIDPFKIDLGFDVIRRLAHLRMDILLMIPLGYDVRRNWREYVDTPSMRDRLSAFLGEYEWIEAWKSLGRPYSEFPRFVQARMNEAMKRLGFMELDHRDIRDVKVAGKNVYLYSLHLFSKSDVAIKFWRNALAGTSEQHSLGI
jgi:three-Cys-motif partner protein